MNVAKISFCILQIAILFLTISCSNSEDSNEKGVIQETQDKIKEKQDEIAQEAIDYIKNPIDQAKAVSKIADDRARQLEETKKQE